MTPQYRVHKGSSVWEIVKKLLNFRNIEYLQSNLNAIVRIRGVHHRFKSWLRQESGFFMSRLFSGTRFQFGQTILKIRNWKFWKTEDLKNFKFFNLFQFFLFQNLNLHLSRPSPDSSLVLIWSRQNPKVSLDSGGEKSTGQNLNWYQWWTFPQTNIILKTCVSGYSRSWILACQARRVS